MHGSLTHMEIIVKAKGGLTGKGTKPPLLVRLHTGYLKKDRYFENRRYM